jgi:hypothetical protein
MEGAVIAAGGQAVSPGWGDSSVRRCADDVGRIDLLLRHEERHGLSTAIHGVGLC